MWAVKIGAFNITLICRVNTYAKTSNVYRRKMLETATAPSLSPDSMHRSIGRSIPSFSTYFNETPTLLL